MWVCVPRSPNTLLLDPGRHWWVNRLGLSIHYENEMHNWTTTFPVNRFEPNVYEDGVLCEYLNITEERWNLEIPRKCRYSVWLVSVRFAFACIVYQRIRAREQFNFVPSSMLSWSPKREIRLNASSLFICCGLWRFFFCKFGAAHFWGVRVRFHFSLPAATSNMRKSARDDLNGRSTVICLLVRRWAKSVHM